MGGLDYQFTYHDNGSSPSPWARGAMRTQKIPTGATVTYQYGTWSFHHYNIQNRAFSCIFPAPAPMRPTFRVGPGVEPNLPPPWDCTSPDRAAGVVQRTVDTDGATTDYWQYNMPRGESDVGSISETPQLGTLRSDALVVGAIVGAEGRERVLRLGLPSGTWRERFQTLLDRATDFLRSTVAQLEEEAEKPRQQRVPRWLPASGAAAGSATATDRRDGLRTGWNREVRRRRGYERDVREPEPGDGHDARPCGETRRPACNKSGRPDRHALQRAHVPGRPDDRRCDARFGI